MSTVINAFTTLSGLLLKEMTIFKKDYWRVTINGLFWAGSLLVTFSFFLPLVGTPVTFGKFMLPAMIASWGMFDIIVNTTVLIGDILGDKSIDYELILPLAQWAVFFKIGVANGYRSFLSTLALLPFGTIFLYLLRGQIFSQISFFKMFFFLIITNLFFGFLALFAASFMQKISDVRNVWMRIIFPLWWIGGFSFSWQTVYQVAPKFAYLMLLNPLVYVNEGMRAAMLGQEKFLPFWICCSVVIGFTLLVGGIGIKKFLKRLDCL